MGQATATDQSASRRPGGRRVRFGLAIGITAFAMTGCGSSERDEPRRQGLVITDPGPVHIHGLGINPKDRALFIATHTGLFRAEAGSSKAVRVADRYQDTMGFTVTGPDRFLGSGHPDLSEGLPPFLGLISSDDAGRTWRSVSLKGDRDFHVLESSGRRVYGWGSDFRTRRESLLTSGDGGRTWRRRRPPGSVQSLAIDPSDPARLVISTPKTLYLSEDAGVHWARLDAPSGLVVWPRRRQLISVLPDGGVMSAASPKGGWRRVGDVGEGPAALDSGAGQLFVALHDGTVKSSRDGRTWSIRLRPSS